MAAAHKVFSTVDFVGMSEEEVRKLLGEPGKKLQLENSEVWSYMFYDGEGGIVRRLHFGKSIPIRVTRVEVVPTE
jgi:hypothetical protein